MNRMDRDELSPEERAELIEWIRQTRRQGAEALHARAAFTKPKTYTDAESAAIARKKLDERGQP